VLGTFATHEVVYLGALLEGEDRMLQMACCLCHVVVKALYRLVARLLSTLGMNEIHFGLPFNSLDLFLWSPVYFHERWSLASALSLYGRSCRLSTITLASCPCPFRLTWMPSSSLRSTSEASICRRGVSLWLIERSRQLVENDRMCTQVQMCRQTRFLPCPQQTQRRWPRGPSTPNFRQTQQLRSSGSD